ncbi:hypothetical protein A1507_13520 [Methylomonas koyamae]|uniref:Uncharacterized protein n=1 Tax=Methylomonas koyamae TaxID=702114 RepID=A0A177NCQ1_9GAMM|nr:hypothetical protein A1507_13520 [Methylomonas koyamae]
MLLKMRTASRKSLSAACVAKPLLCIRKPRLPATSINWLKGKYSAGPHDTLGLWLQPIALEPMLGLLPISEI